MKIVTLASRFSEFGIVLITLIVSIGDRNFWGKSILVNFVALKWKKINYYDNIIIILLFPVAQKGVFNKYMQSSDISYPETYTEAEVREILQLAFTNQINSSSSLTKEQLWATGTEFGLDLVTIQQAEKHWLNEQATNLQRQEFNRYRRQEIINKIIRFALINSIIVILDLLSTHHLSWSIYLIFVWGLIFSFGLWRISQPSQDEYEQAFQRWRVRQELKSSFSTAWEKVKQAWQNQNNDLEIN